MQKRMGPISSSGPESGRLSCTGVEPGHVMEWGLPTALWARSAESGGDGVQVLVL